MEKSGGKPKPSAAVMLVSLLLSPRADYFTHMVTPA
jgi:hypothetical protein